MTTAGASVAVVVSVAAALAAASCGGGTRDARTPAPLAGRIVVQASIDRLALGMSPTEVRRIYGEPEAVKHYSESETGKPIDDWVYRRRSLVAEFREVRDGRLSLAGITTFSRRQRTESGIGVGSTEAELTREIDGADCGETDPGERWCTVGGGGRDAAQTVFVLRRGKVTEVRVLITFL
jgi:hypothetical protein